MIAPRWLLVLAVLALPAYVRANAPYSDPEYLEDVWQAEQGLPNSTVTSMVQTPDGYLWLGTYAGLLRFDGIEFTVFDRTNAPALPSSAVVNLFRDRSGRLWISTMLGMASVKDGQWQTFGSGSGWTGNYAWAFAEGKGGELYVTTFDSKILRYQDGRFQELPTPPGNPVTFFPFVDASGRPGVVSDHFIGTLVDGQWRETAPVDRLHVGEPAGSVSLAAGPARDGGVWISTEHAVWKYRDGQLQLASRAPWPIETHWSVHEDRTGNIWICSIGAGFYRLSPDGSWRHFTTETGAAHRFTRFVFEDAESNLWIGTDDAGIQRLKRRYLTSWARGEGRSQRRIVKAITADASGRILLGTYGQGVVRLDEKGITPILEPQARNFGAHAGTCAAFNGSVFSLLSDRRGQLWIGTTFDAGQTQLPLYVLDASSCRRADPGGTIASTKTASVYSLFEDSRGQVWIGTDAAIVRANADGTYRRFEIEPSPHLNNIQAFAEDPTSGALYAGGAAGRLYRWASDRFEVVPEASDLLDDSIDALQVGADGTLWIATYDGGIAALREGRLSRIAEEQGLPASSILSMRLDADANLWLGSNHGIVRLAGNALHKTLQEALPPSFRMFTQSDGLPTLELSTASMTDRQGRLWFGTHNGAVALDPRNLPPPPPPPRIVIEKLSIDGQNAGDPARFNTTAAEPEASLVVPPGAHRLEIRYAGLSFTAPEKVRFRYKLAGYDPDWVDVGSRRIAYYAKLPPGHYDFSVMASNDGGVWSASAARCDIVVTPTFYQTVAFRILAVLAVALLLWWLYRRRLWQLAAQMQVRFDERLAERTRIAQELHDTLLQDVIGSSIQLQVATRQLHTEPDTALKTLAEVTENLEQSVQSSREAVRGLRSAEKEDLASALSRFADEMRGAATAEVRVTLHGQPRLFNALADYEVRRIAREALRNALHHAQAQTVEAVIDYGDEELRVDINDDGVGIDEKTIAAGRDGHFGLKGMRERAARIGGALTVYRHAPHGTTVTLVVPSEYAYARTHA
jgi:signal transduction histidine kinase/ligand-binding sensor domain-containing protein